MWQAVYTRCHGVVFDQPEPTVLFTGTKAGNIFWLCRYDSDRHPGKRPKHFTFFRGWSKTTPRRSMWQAVYTGCHGVVFDQPEPTVLFTGTKAGNIFWLCRYDSDRHPGKRPKHFTFFRGWSKTTPRRSMW